MSKKKESNQITLKVRRSTNERWDRDHAEYCGVTGKVISKSEYLDLLEKPQKKVDKKQQS